MEILVTIVWFSEITTPSHIFFFALGSLAASYQTFEHDQVGPGSSIKWSPQVPRYQGRGSCIDGGSVPRRNPELPIYIEPTQPTGAPRVKLESA